MSDGIRIHTLRVFGDHHGQFGNPLGIILDEGKKINPIDRQRIATQLGFSESVFINELRTRNVSIFNPRSEVSFSGHAMLGTAWFINRMRGSPLESLRCSDGFIKTWRDKDKTWIRASLRVMPPWQY